MKGLRESFVKFCDIPRILCSVSTLSKRILTNSMEFKRKLVVRRHWGAVTESTQISVLLSQAGNQTVQEKPW